MTVPTTNGARDGQVATESAVAVPTMSGGDRALRQRLRGDRPQPVAERRPADPGPRPRLGAVAEGHLAPPPSLVIGVPPLRRPPQRPSGEYMDRAPPVASPPRGEMRVRWRLPGPPAIIRHRPRTRGVAAQHASLSRWRSPVRIRSGPPSLTASSHAPSARPDGAFLCPPTAVTGPVRYPAARDRPRSRLQPEGAEAPRGTPVVARAGGRRRARHRRRDRVRRRRRSAASAAPPRRPRRPRSRPATASPGRPVRDARRGRARQRAACLRGAVGVGGRPAPLVESDVAIVPVTNFRSGRTAARTADVRAIPGGDGTYTEPRARRGGRRRDPRDARRDPRRAGRRAHDRSTRPTTCARGCRSTARRSRSCARTTSTSRSGRSPGAPTRCSAWTG